MSARLRRSTKLRHASSSRARTPSTSGASGAGAGADAQAPSARQSRRRASPRALLRLGALTLGPELLLARLLELLLHAVAEPIVLVHGDGLFPGRDRLLDLAVLHVGVGQVVEDLRVVLGPLGGALELPEGLRVLALLVVGPAEAVDEVAVVGVELERLLDELHRFGEVLPPLGVHVADVVVGLRVLGIERDYAAEGGDGVVEPLLLLPHHAELEVEILAPVVELQPLAEHVGGPVVLVAAEQRGAEVEEELRPP